MEDEMEKLQVIYDQFASGYDRGRAAFDNGDQLRLLLERLPAGAAVLDAGCGSGYPVLQFFAERDCSVTGTDISPEMLRLAARHVPQARLEEVDSATLDFEEKTFDLITSFYSLFHLEMEKQRLAFSCFYRMLRSGGFAYFTLASKSYTGVDEFSGTKVFAGTELPYHHVTPEAYRILLEAVGFVVESMDLLCIGGETMLWVWARK